MDYCLLQTMLSKEFTFGKETLPETNNYFIRYLNFNSEWVNTPFSNTVAKGIFNDSINENQSFQYPVFIPTSESKFSQAILLLHGLNERNWNKYLSWAGFLCQQTQRPVILFPMAYHINRSPDSWSNPRELEEIFSIRRKQYANDRSISFANITLSNRLSQEPFRFFNSGKQSLNDIYKLTATIKDGTHPLFKSDTHIDIFAYSIGAFLAEIALMADTQHLFQNSKLFMFCGGGVFSSMFGESRLIMDKFSFERIFNFYKNEFINNLECKSNDSIVTSFISMISEENKTEERIRFFEQNAHRISGIMLQKDKVMPYIGAELAMGKQLANKKIEYLNFDYNYTHENPFPIGNSVTNNIVNEAFCYVFEKAVDFFKQT